MNKIRAIEISFPVDVEPPQGWEQTLIALVDMICKQYEESHPDRIMWPAGIGAKVLWREPEEPNFDSQVLAIDVSEREAYPKEIERRQWQKMTPEQRKQAVEADRAAAGKTGEQK